MKDYSVLAAAARHARQYLDGLPARPVGRPVEPDVLRKMLGGPLPDEGEPAERVIEKLVRDADAGLVATAGPRYFGFVIGAALPAAVAADWLTSAWDQNAGLYISSPAAAVIEDILAGWITELLDLPAGAGVGFVTGGTMANFTCLAAARNDVLRKAGWDVEADGLQGAPTVTVVTGEEAHASIPAVLRRLGLGERRIRLVPADDEGRMRPDELERVLADVRGPTIVCAQAGNVNTGAFDPFGRIADVTRARGVWLHVDGAFGLWAAAVPRLRRHLTGANRADSWSLDAHKWLNVPQDSGIAITAHPEAHRAAMGYGASYLLTSAARDPHDWTPEASRRARGFAIYAALRALGRRGIAELVDRCCRLASQMASHLGAVPGVEILNEVVLNQVLVGFSPRGPGGADELTERIIARVQQDGTCWLGGTRWHGRAAMRISVSGWGTTEEDIARSAEAIRSAYAAEVSE